MAAILSVDRIQSRDGVSKLLLENMPSGYVLASTIIRSSTRTAVSTAAESVIFSGSFTKQRADTNLAATCTVFGAGYYSGNCGVGMRIDSSNWDYGVAYQYDGAWSSTIQTTIIVGHSYWTGVTAGAHTIGFGWKTADAGASNRPFNILNPNSTEESRNQQMVSTIILYEIYP